MTTLDDTDRKIIAILRENAREPIKGIATKTGIARSTVRHRLERLENSGVIAGYKAIVRQEQSTGVEAFLLARLNQTPAYDLIGKLSGIPEIQRCSSLSGEIDLIIEVVAAHAERLNEIRDLVANEAVVESLTTSIILSRNIDRNIDMA